MERLQKYRLQIVSSVAGVLLGYLIIHPFSMIVSALIHVHQNDTRHLHWQSLVSAKALETFGPIMLPMAIAFALLGGVIGLLAGTLMAKRQRLQQAELVKAKKRIALETMRNLLVTLSHYLLNANMIIGGKVRHIRRYVSDQDIMASLAVIEEQGRKIDSVLNALKRVTELKTADYTADGQVVMIDITKELEEQLGQEKEGQ